MGFSNVLDSAKGLFHKTVWAAQKHAPEILLVSGIVSTVASVAFACRATVKAQPIVKCAKETLEIAKENLEAGKTGTGDEYTEQDYKADVRTIKVQAGIDIAKEFAVPIAFLGGSIVCQVCGWKTLRDRLAASAAAYAALMAKFNKYRSRNRDKIGIEAENEMYNGLSTTQTHETCPDGEPIEGHQLIIADDDDYTAVFDHRSTEWERDVDQNLTFLQQKQEYWTKILKIRNGRPVWLNEVKRDLDQFGLGIPQTQMGQICGWRYDESPDHVGDNRILFGIDQYIEWARKHASDETPCENTFVLNFNCDGNVLYAAGNKKA